MSKKKLETNGSSRSRSFKRSLAHICLTFFRLTHTIESEAKSLLMLETVGLGQRTNYQD
jgi:hypothetical protein